MERNNFWLPVLCVALGGLNGFNIGRAVGENSSNSYGDQRVHEVQLENEQLNKQLSQNGRLVARLVLDDGNKSFSFDTVNTENQNEICSGKYEVGKNSTATTVGKLACTIDVPVR